MKGGGPTLVIHASIIWTLLEFSGRASTKSLYCCFVVSGVNTMTIGVWTDVAVHVVLVALGVGMEAMGELGGGGVTAWTPRRIRIDRTMAGLEENKYIDLSSEDVFLQTPAAAPAPATTRPGTPIGAICQS